MRRPSAANEIKLTHIAAHLYAELFWRWLTIYLDRFSQGTFTRWGHHIYQTRSKARLGCVSNGAGDENLFHDFTIAFLVGWCDPASLTIRDSPWPSWFKHEFIQEEIKMQWMVMGSPTSLPLTGGELIYTQLNNNSNNSSSNNKKKNKTKKQQTTTTTNVWRTQQTNTKTATRKRSKQIVAENNVG